VRTPLTRFFSITSENYLFPFPWIFVILIDFAENTVAVNVFVGWCSGYGGWGGGTHAPGRDDLTEGPILLVPLSNRHIMLTG